MGRAWIPKLLTTAALLVSTMTAAAAESITLNYQQPQDGIYYEYLRIQFMNRKTIDADNKPVVSAKKVWGYFINKTVASVPEGYRVSVAVKGWNPRDGEVELHQLGFALKNRMSNSEMDKAFESFMNLNPPDYIVVSTGKIIQVLVTEAYQDRVSLLAY